ncbi:MAG TPA: CpsB/CapC family capsule biosynthesis tyrosine phosphatase [Gemmatimonadales bacterium]|nr:CpsB/CapC family capsule biosynthesis tyrosine phosphatase [Gemmatimonadales bacterium]
MTIALADLHSHLVPGVDDGTTSVEESLESLRSLRAEGVAALITTPHLLLPRLETQAEIERELDGHRRAFDRLLLAGVGASDLPAVGLGQEIWASNATEIRRVLGRSDVGLGGTEYLLIEFGFRLTGTHMDVVDAVIDAGRRIVISHPERYEYVAGTNPLELAKAWRERGALLQINAGSLNGYYTAANPGSKRLAWAFIQTGIADLISTDHHGARRAGVSPLEAWDTLVAHGYEEYAEQLMSIKPGQIVNAGDLALVESSEAP